MAAIATSNLLSPLHSPSHGKDYPPISSSIVPRFSDSHLSKPKVTLKRSRNASILPVIRAQNSPGFFVSDVRGFGAQGGSTERHGGSEFSEDKFVAKVTMEIVVEAVIDKIIEEARTGKISDGKTFLIPVADVIRDRTGERGEKAERMSGGCADMSATTLT